MFNGMKTTLIAVTGMVVGYLGAMTFTGCTGSGCTEEKEAICDTTKSDTVVVEIAGNVITVTDDSVSVTEDSTSVVE